MVLLKIECNNGTSSSRLQFPSNATQQLAVLSVPEMCIDQFCLEVQQQNTIKLGNSVHASLITFI